MGALAELDVGTRDYLSGATEEIIKCRLLGHCWDGNPSEYIVRGHGRDRVHTQTVRCMRCGSEGVDRFRPVTRTSRRRERIGSRSYAYVEGYLRRDSKGALSREEIRAWLDEQSKRSSRRLRRVS